MTIASRSRTVTWDDPLELTARVAGRAGIDVLREIASGETPAWPMTRLIGMRLVEVDAGRAVVEATPAEWHYNPACVVHGGFAAAVLDTAVGCAVYSTIEAGRAYTTIELKVNYVKAMTAATGVVRATGRVLHRGGRTAVADGRLEDADGTLLAHATTTCLIYEA